MPKKIILTKEVLSTVNDDQYQIFSTAEAKIAREKRLTHIKNNYYLTCVEAKMCPVCGSENVKIVNKSTYHERMMEDEYDFTIIDCRSCGKVTRVFIADFT